MSPNKSASNMTPALLVRLNEVKQDPALQTRGDRKLLVTEVYAAKEEEATDIEWRFQTSSGKCPVQLMRDTESAVFTQVAKPTRHYHKLGTEIYLVLEGSMIIEVERVDYRLEPGDIRVPRQRRASFAVKKRQEARGETAAENTGRDASTALSSTPLTAGSAGACAAKSQTVGGRRPPLQQIRVDSRAFVVKKAVWLVSCIQTAAARQGNFSLELQPKNS